MTLDRLHDRIMLRPWKKASRNRRDHQPGPGQGEPQQGTSSRGNGHCNDTASASLSMSRRANVILVGNFVFLHKPEVTLDARITLPLILREDEVWPSWTRPDEEEVPRTAER